MPATVTWKTSPSLSGWSSEARLGETATGSGSVAAVSIAAGSCRSTGVPRVIASYCGASMTTSSRRLPVLSATCASKPVAAVVTPGRAAGSMLGGRSPPRDTSSYGAPTLCQAAMSAPESRWTSVAAANAALAVQASRMRSTTPPVPPRVARRRASTDTTPRRFAAR